MNHVHCVKPVVDSSVKSVKRALDLLELLAEQREPLSFLDLMGRLAIPRSSLFHLMGQLISRGYVEEVVSGSRYRLGRMPSAIAATAARRSWLIEAVRPALAELSLTTEEFTAFYVVEGDLVRGRAVQEGRHALSYRIAPDHRVPLHAFAAGKVALAELSPEALESYFARIEPTAFTTNTLTDPAALRRTVAGVRRTGIGRSRSEYALGVAGFAMAVRVGSELIGIINVSVPEPRMSRDHARRVIEALRAVVKTLEERLSTAPA